MGFCDLASSCANGDTVYYPGSTFFIDPDNMSPTQLIWTFVAYGYVLFISADMIGDGAELLLLIPKYKDLVASVVLPILGAVPDGMMVLFSGVGPLAVAQENVAVGVGALAGSTIMLLTLPWVLSFYGGKVDMDDSGTLAYDRSKSKRDTATGAAIIFKTGVEFEVGAKTNAKLMMLTCLSYFCIQIPAFTVDDQKAKAEYASEKDYIAAVKSESSAVHLPALIGMIVTVGFLAYYLYLQVKAAGSGEKTGVSAKALSDGWLLEKGIRMHIQYLRDRVKEQYPDYRSYVAQSNAIQGGLRLSSDMESELRNLFRSYSKKSTGTGIKQQDMHNALCNIGLTYKREDFNKKFDQADRDKSKTLEEDEFIEFFTKYVVFSADPLPWEGDDDEEDDDDEVPDEFKELDPKAQQKAILKESLRKMILGTVLVLIFSDPMVDVLAEIGKMTGVPPFYVSFVLAPLASNASELVASFKLAAKKSSESITQSIQTLEGAAIMNNTFCLGIFYALIYMQGLAWKFTAETFSIVFVQLLVGILMILKTKQTMMYGIIVFTLYPVSLVIVAGLEAMGLD